MLKAIVLIGYLIIGVYHLYQAYIESEVEDQKDRGYIIGLLIMSMLWPLVYLIVIICETVKVCYAEED